MSDKLYARKIASLGPAMSVVSTVSCRDAFFSSFILLSKKMSQMLNANGLRFLGPQARRPKS